MTTVNVQDLIGRTAVDSAGEKVGKIEQVYLDNETGQPNWVAISSGLMGRRSNFAPMHNAQLSGEDVQLGVTKQKESHRWLRQASAMWCCSSTTCSRPC